MKLQIGGSLYDRILPFLAEIEQGLVNSCEIQSFVDQFNQATAQFRLNHQVSLEFLTAEDLNTKSKLQELRKIIKLVIQLKYDEDERQKAYETISKYR